MNAEAFLNRGGIGNDKGSHFVLQSLLVKKSLRVQAVFSFPCLVPMLARGASSVKKFVNYSLVNEAKQDIDGTREIIACSFRASPVKW